jgi:membrane-associated protease RseP (regulator of RpoE activity)
MLLLKVALQFQGISREFCYLAAQVNFSLFLFNLLPIPPLDGYQALGGLIPSLKDRMDARTGLFMITFLFLHPGFSSGLGMRSNPNTPCLNPLGQIGEAGFNCGVH